jgi:hypothetical protein
VINFFIDKKFATEVKLCAKRSLDIAGASLHERLEISRRHHLLGFILRHFLDFISGLCSFIEILVGQ